jgi:hypothetical protein
MAINSLSSNDWKLIVDRIRDGQCVPFLGAGVNATSDDGTYEGLPLGGQVSFQLLEKWLDLKGVDLGKLVKIVTYKAIDDSDRYVDLKRIGLENLARVSLHVEYVDDFKLLIKYLREILPDEKRDPSPLLRTLARLPEPSVQTDPPFQLIVTTNYDCLMERAFSEAGVKVKVIVQPKKGFTPKEQRTLQDELALYRGVVLYKIHGTFIADRKKENPEIIITEEDYIEFLHSVVNSKKGVPGLISGKLQGSTLLFLGYSLEDLDFRTLFKGMIEKLPDREKVKSFAIQRRPSPFWVDFWTAKKVIIRDLDLYTFAEELRLQLGISLPNPNVPSSLPNK